MSDMLQYAKQCIANASWPVALAMPLQTVLPKIKLEKGRGPQYNLVGRSASQSSANKKLETLPFLWRDGDDFRYLP